MAISTTVLHRQITDLQYEVTSLSRIFVKFRGYVNKHFDQVYLRLESVERRLDGVEQRLDRVEERLDRVEQRLDGVERRLTSIEAVMVTKNDLNKAVQQLSELIVKYNRG